MLGASTDFSSDSSLRLFWLLHTGEALTALGKRAHPVACGDILRRLIEMNSYREYFAGLEDLLEALGRCGVRIKGGVELVAKKAMLDHQGGALSCPLMASTRMTLSSNLESSSPWRNGSLRSRAMPPSFIPRLRQKSFFFRTENGRIQDDTWGIDGPAWQGSGYSEIQTQSTRKRNDNMWIH